MTVEDTLARWLDANPAHLSRSSGTNTGRTVHIRAIRHDDDALEEAFVRALSWESGS
jgi:hypothetical protein